MPRPHRPSRPRDSARARVAHAIARSVLQFPELDPSTLDLAGLDDRDSRLAHAIHRTVLQRWLTLEHILSLGLNRPLAAVEPTLRAVLLTASAQLLFMDRLPAHAVVDESVELARRMVRPGAAGIANAVLRRVASLPQEAVRTRDWTPAADRLPLEDGYVPLAEPCLPDPEDIHSHLSVATSHPVPLVRAWIEQLGLERALAACQHSLRTAPTIVTVESPSAIPADLAVPHEKEGFAVWRGTHDQLVAFLREHPGRRVQDPAAAGAVASTAALQPRTILDWCAGRGTKTRQLAQLHPDARVIATDIDSGRLDDLRRSTAGLPNVTVIEYARAQSLPPRSVDLLLLDVPCSNTGVLARRLEARYRYHAATLRSLTQLQRQIAAHALGLLRPGAHLLYSTCSIDEDENQRQVRRLAVEHHATVVQESFTLPAGTATAYHDGAFHATLRLTDSPPKP